MAVQYTKLWKMLIDKKMKRTDLIASAGISANILAKLGKDEFVSMESLEKICKSLDCNIGDIVDFVFEDTNYQR
ncbi:MAG: helix-turn-helix transcriptional regulator [Acutalibacter sp.]|nr:helix-turn-helix transcriptional regulator [Acutalibacter sp.]